MQPHRSTSRRLLAALQIGVTVAALWYAAVKFSVQWREVRAVASDLRPAWGWIGAGSMIVLATHAMLVQGWRVLLAGWHEAPPFWVSARIWATSNLGKYVPGKVWGIGAQSLLASRVGVSGTAAASAALLGTLVNIGAGFGVVAVGGTAALAQIRPWIPAATTILAVAFVIGVGLLPWILPPVTSWLLALRKLPPLDRHLSAGRLWAVTLLNVCSWISYGVAFQCFALGITPGIIGNSVAFITVYSASYIFGFLILFSPGGVGFRELALVVMLVSLGMGSEATATVLAAASRVWITILELVPGLLALLLTIRSARAGRPASG